MKQLSEHQIMRNADRLLDPPDIDKEESFIEGWLESSDYEYWLEESSLIVAEGNDVIWDNSGRRIIFGLLFETVIHSLQMSEDGQFDSLSNELIQAVIKKQSIKIENITIELNKLMMNHAKKMLKNIAIDYARFLYKKIKDDSCEDAVCVGRE